MQKKKHPRARIQQFSQDKLSRLAIVFSPPPPPFGCQIIYCTPGREGWGQNRWSFPCAAFLCQSETISLLFDVLSLQHKQTKLWKFEAHIVAVWASHRLLSLPLQCKILDARLVLSWLQCSENDTQTSPATREHFGTYMRHDWYCHLCYEVLTVPEEKENSSNNPGLDHESKPASVALFRWFWWRNEPPAWTTHYPTIKVQVHTWVHHWTQNPIVLTLFAQTKSVLWSWNSLTPFRDSPSVLLKNRWVLLNSKRLNPNSHFIWSPLQTHILPLQCSSVHFI